MTVRIRNASADGAQTNIKAAAKAPRKVKAHDGASVEIAEPAASEAIPVNSASEEVGRVHADKSGESGPDQSVSGNPETASAGEAPASLAQDDGGLFGRELAA
jgi:hypothetical protein